MNYLVQGLFPAVTALVLAKFFDASGGSRAEYHAESCLVWQFVCRHKCSVQYVVCSDFCSQCSAVFCRESFKGQGVLFAQEGAGEKVRRLEYLWKLFHNKQTVKEMRIMGFGDYLFQKWVETRDEVNKRGNMKAGYKRWDVNAVL